MVPRTGHAAGQANSARAEPFLLSRSDTPLPGPAGRFPMTIATNLGFSRMGPHRELKKAMERFWATKSDGEELLATAGERDPK